MANNLMRFDPFSPFSEIARFEPFRDIEEMMKDFRMKPLFRDIETEPRIRMDVSETDKDYLIKAEIPGVKKEDIKVAIEGNHVSISAEIKKMSEEKAGETVVRSERYYGKQYRSFTLASEVDDTKADAKYQDGVLELSLPKKAGSKTGKQLVVH